MKTMLRNFYFILHNNLLNYRVYFCSKSNFNCFMDIDSRHKKCWFKHLCMINSRLIHTESKNNQEDVFVVCSLINFVLSMIMYECIKEGTNKLLKNLKKHFTLIHKNLHQTKTSCISCYKQNEAIYIF